MPIYACQAKIKANTSPKLKESEVVIQIKAPGEKEARAEIIKTLEEKHPKVARKNWYLYRPFLMQYF